MEITTAEREQLAKLRAESAGFDFEAITEQRREYYRRLIEIGAADEDPKVLAPLRLIREMSQALESKSLLLERAKQRATEAAKDHDAERDELDDLLKQVQLDPTAGPLVSRVAGLVEAYIQITTETEDDERGLPRALAMARAEDLR